MWYGGVLSNRSRPRSTRINKRFLSRTVASAALSRPSRRRQAAASSTSCSPRDADDETQRHNQQQQQQSIVSDHRQRSTARVGKTDKRKHWTDCTESKTDGFSDRRQIDVYDVDDYVTLNRNYTLDKSRKMTHRSSVHRSHSAHRTE